MRHARFKPCKLRPLVAGSALIAALAAAQAAPAQLTPPQLLACIELDEAVQAGIKAHEEVVAQQVLAAQAIEVEKVELQGLQQRLTSLDPTARQAVARRVEAFNERVGAFNAKAAALESEEARLGAEVLRYNQDCTGRPYDPRDKQQALAEHQAHKRAAAAAGPFKAGVEAFDKGNHAEALAHWLPLAEQGRAVAQFNVAVMYEQGLGVNKDQAQAARWFVAAATAGVASAQLKAGTLYESGQGVAKDLSSASYWYGEAANSSGSKDADIAKQARDRLALLPPQYRMGLEEIVAFDGGRFVLRRAANKECVIALQGEVTQSANVEFDRVIEKAKAVGCARPLVLLLESPGGSVDAGLELAQSVRAEGMRTIARYECASSCANIFLGGSERVLKGSRAAIGLHQLSRTSGEGNARITTCVTARDDPALRALRRHLWFVVSETADQILRIVMATPCNAIEWVRGKRALDLQLATRIEAPDDDLFGPPASRLGSSGAAPR
jgi:hypothetical protein